MNVGWLQDRFRRVQDGCLIILGWLQVCYMDVLGLLQYGYSISLDRIVYGWLQDVMGWFEDY